LDERIQRRQHSRPSQFFLRLQMKTDHRRSFGFQFMLSTLCEMTCRVKKWIDKFTEPGPDDLPKSPS
jgi:hypothetical protein